MKLQVIKNRVLYWLKNIVLYSLYLSLILTISSFFILQIPSVQTSLTKRYLKSFSSVTGFTTGIQRVELRWFDRLYMEGLTITDPEGNIMIGVDRLLVNFRFTEIVAGNNVSLDAALLDSVQVNLKTISDSESTRDLNINLFVARINEMAGDAQGGGGGGMVSIGEAIIKNARFTYSTDAEPLAAGFDPNHFAVSIPEIEAHQFMILGDTIQFDVTHLTAREENLDFRIHRLSTFFRLSQQSLEFLGLQLSAGESFVSDTIRFQFESQLALGDFVNEVDIYANLENTRIYAPDLALFAQTPDGVTKQIAVNGKLNGRINNFRFTQMDLKLDDTHLQGSLEMDGLPEINETFIFLSLRQSQIDFSNLTFLFNEATIERLKPLGMLNFRGQFLGYPTDFVAAGDFVSRIGRISSDINFKLNEQAIDKSEYSGKLTLHDFDLGVYLNDTVNFQKVSMSGELKGRGLTIETADFALNGTIHSIGVRNYPYSNIVTNARFASQFFKGELEINDPNIGFTAEGSIDLRDNANLVKITGSLDTAYFHNLNLSKREVFLNAQLNIDIQGLELDSMLGAIDLRNVFLKVDDESVTLDYVSLLSRKEAEQRFLKLETSVLDADVRGNYYFSHLFRDIPVLVHELRLNIENNAEAIAQYYKNKKEAPGQYAADFRFTIKDLKPVTDILDVDLMVSRNTLVEGRYSNGPTSNLQFFSTIDSIATGNQFFFKTDLEFNASKTYDSTEALAMLYIFSRTQQLGAVKTQDLMTEVIWDRTHIDVDLGIAQQETTNRVNIRGTVDFRNRTHVKLRSSVIHVLDKKWLVHPDNSLVIAGKEWAFENFGFLQGDQSIILSGQLSEDSARFATLNIRNFDLANINPIIIRKLSGEMDASFVLNNFYGDRSIENRLLIEDLKVDDFLFGHVTGNNVWDPDANKFITEFIIDRLDTRIVNCSGHYDPADRENPLNIRATFNEANLKIFEPFIDELFSQFQGTLSGVYTITGTLAEPKLNGEGRVDNGGLMVNYLRTVYQFKGAIGLTPTSIYFKDIELTDAFRNNARLNGSITHANFIDMRISLSGQFDDFQVLNTTARDNSLFYGQAYASGRVGINGPIDNLVITSTATTRKNTRIYIPISGTSAVEQKEYINFVSFRDSTYLASLSTEATRKVALTGVTIDFNIDVTPDAYCEIIFDLKAGDIIRGRGNGKLNLQLDTKGEFNMFGPIEFTEGWYNFTLYDIINKEFHIQPGSSIAWYGDPYQGTLKIEATYNQLASLAPILADPSFANIPQLKRKYPVQVLLKLDGPMLSPAINFDILAKDLPKSVAVEGRPPVSLDIEFAAFKSRLDEQELKRQVFSLIILRRFSPPESFNTSGSLVNSVSELFSNQLSYWLSQVDENLEIDVDLGSMDQETFNTFQLRLSYTFLNGRLRVTRDGTVGNQPMGPGAEARNDIATAIGDWTVDYMLSPDGKFKVKMYSRANFNPVATSLNAQNAITTGVSLMHTQSFNEVKDLFRASREKNRRTTPPDEELNEEALKEDEDGG